MPGAGSDRRRWVSCAGGAFVGWVRGLSGDGREGFMRGRGRRSGGRAPVIRKRRGQIRLLLILTQTRGAGGSAPGIGSRDAPRPIERRRFARVLRGRSRGGAHLDDAARERAGGGSHLCLFSTVRRPFVLRFSGGPLRCLPPSADETGDANSGARVEEPVRWTLARVQSRGSASCRAKRAPCDCADHGWFTAGPL